MTPYYDNGKGIVLYCGDCQEVLPKITKCDLLLTDPPYGIGEARKNFTSRSVLAKATDYGKADWDDKPPPRELLDKWRALTKWQIIWGGNYFWLPPSSCWLVWDKDNGGSDFADCELAWTNFKKAVRMIKYRWAGMLQKLSGHKKESRWHPTQKPLRVIEWALGHAPTDVVTVLDPYAGSGTTLVAAMYANKHAIGIEQSEEYCEIAVRRLKQPKGYYDYPKPKRLRVINTVTKSTKRTTKQ